MRCCDGSCRCTWAVEGECRWVGAVTASGASGRIKRGFFMMKGVARVLCGRRTVSSGFFDDGLG